MSKRSGSVSTLKGIVKDFISFCPPPPDTHTHPPARQHTNTHTCIHIRERPSAPNLSLAQMVKYLGNNVTQDHGFMDLYLFSRDQKAYSSEGGSSKVV